MKKLLSIAGFILGAFFLFVSSVSATSTLLIQQGGTSSTTLSGILIGNGLTGLNAAINTLTVGSGLTLTGTTLATSGGSNASSTLLSDSNTFSGNNTFTQLITGAISGNAGTATKLATGRTLSITGDLVYTSPSFDGSGNVTAAGTLATVNSNVGTFTYPSVTVNGKGLVTAISNGTAPTTYTGTFPIAITGSVISFGGLSTSTPAVLGNIPYFSGVNTFANVATTTVSCAGLASCSPFVVIGSSPFTITGSGDGTFSTTSASYFSSLGLAFSTTSANYNFTTNLAATTSVKSITTLSTLSLPYTQLTGVPSFDTFAFPFTPTSYGNATGTLIGFTNGILVVGSSTIVGNATTTGMHAFGSVRIPTLGVAAGQFAAFDSNGVLIGTTTPINTGGSSEGVQWATAAVLGGTPTYSNGTLGVGATLTEIGTGALSVDGNAPASGDRVLIKNQASAFQNGIYVVTATGSGIASYILTRSTDYNSNTEITPGLTTYVVSGTANLDSTWAVSFTVPLTMGTTNLNYTEVSGGGATVTSVSNSDSSLTFSPTTGAVVGSLNINHSNIWTALQVFNASEGVGSSTPFSALSVGTGAASSSITVAEYKYGKSGNVATSTAQNIDCNASTQIAEPIGTSATTLTLINLIPGKKCIVVIQNPNATAGALTWTVPSGYTLKWAGGTIPTATATANASDVWSFLSSMGSSSIDVFGAATTGF